MPPLTEPVEVDWGLLLIVAACVTLCGYGLGWLHGHWCGWRDRERAARTRNGRRLRL